MAGERGQKRLEILTKEAETNPNIETPTLTVMDVKEQGQITLISEYRHHYI